MYIIQATMPPPPPGSYRQIGNEERKILEKDKAFVKSLHLAKIKLLA
jgi:hypothetical protein